MIEPSMRIVARNSKQATRGDCGIDKNNQLNRKISCSRLNRLYIDKSFMSGASKRRGKSRSLWVSDILWKEIGEAAATRGGISMYLKSLHGINMNGGVDWNRVTTNGK